MSQIAVQDNRKKLVIFPDQFFPYNAPVCRRVRVIGSTRKKDLSKFISGKEKGSLLFGLPFFRGKYHIALQGILPFANPTKQSQSPGSQALYLARWEGAEEKWLLQYLPPNAQTSCHYHEGAKETFYSLAGFAILMTGKGDNKDMLLGNKTSCFVRPGIPHEIKTEPTSGALNLIHIRGNMLRFKHTYVPPIEREIDWEQYSLTP